LKKTTECKRYDVTCLQTLTRDKCPIPIAQLHSKSLKQSFGYQAA